MNTRKTIFTLTLPILFLLVTFYQVNPVYSKSKTQLDNTPTPTKEPISPENDKQIDGTQSNISDSDVGGGVPPYGIGGGFKTSFQTLSGSDYPIIIDYSQTDNWSSSVAGMVAINVRKDSDTPSINPSIAITPTGKYFVIDRAYTSLIQSFQTDRLKWEWLLTPNEYPNQDPSSKIITSSLILELYDVTNHEVVNQENYVRTFPIDILLTKPNRNQPTLESPPLPTQTTYPTPTPKSTLSTAPAPTPLPVIPIAHSNDRNWNEIAITIMLIIIFVLLCILIYLTLDSHRRQSLQKTTQPVQLPDIEQQERLLQALQKYYDLQELKQLCFNLKLDSENYDTTSKDAMTLEFVQHMGRVNRLNELENKIREDRPQYSKY